MGYIEYDEIMGKKIKDLSNQELSNYHFIYIKKLQAIRLEVEKRYIANGEVTDKVGWVPMDGCERCEG